MLISNFLGEYLSIFQEVYYHIKFLFEGNNFGHYFTLYFV